MRFRLRYGPHDLQLTEGQFVIGRSASCQLSVDDPLVSRRHAVITVGPESVAVEDLGSRNGIQVNGEKVDGKQALKDGDRLLVGNQEMVLIAGGRSLHETVAGPITQRGDAFQLLASVADKALALGHGDEAERILGTYLDQLLKEISAGREKSAGDTERAAVYATKLAAATGRGQWFDYIVKLYTPLRRPLPTTVVDQLYVVLRKLRSVELELLRAYIAQLKQHAAEFGPAERFLVGRIEGLERLAALK